MWVPSCGSQTLVSLALHPIHALLTSFWCSEGAPRSPCLSSLFWSLQLEWSPPLFESRRYLHLWLPTRLWPMAHSGVCVCVSLGRLALTWVSLGIFTSQRTPSPKHWGYAFGCMEEPLCQKTIRHTILRNPCTVLGDRFCDWREHCVWNEKTISHLPTAQPAGFVTPNELPDFWASVCTSG